MKSWNWRRITTVTTLAALAATALTYWNILDPLHAITAATLTSTLSIIWSASEATTEDPTWPHTTTETRTGARHDVSDLGWSVFGRDGHVTDRVVHRIRTLAAKRLTAHGIDPTDPAAHPDIERLLGPGTLRQLLSNQPPTARTVQRWLDAIEHLGPTPTTAPTPRTRPAHPQENNV